MLTLSAQHGGLDHRDRRAGHGEGRRHRAQPHRALGVRRVRRRSIGEAELLRRRRTRSSVYGFGARRLLRERGARAARRGRAGHGRARGTEVARADPRHLRIGANGARDRAAAARVLARDPARVTKPGRVRTHPNARAAERRVACTSPRYVDDGAVLGAGTKVWHFCHVMARCGDRDRVQHRTERRRDAARAARPQRESAEQREHLRGRGLRG